MNELEMAGIDELLQQGGRHAEMVVELRMLVAEMDDLGTQPWAVLITEILDRYSDRLQLRYGRELKFQEIADEVQLSSADAARMRVNRALGRVADRASRGTVRWVAGMDLSPKGQVWLNGKTGAVE